MDKKILIDAKEKKAKLLKELRELDIVIEYLERNTKASEKPAAAKRELTEKRGSKFTRVGALCVELMKKEQNITSSSQFMKYTNEKGINISPAGLAIALRKEGLVFNREKKLWELTK